MDRNLVSHESTHVCHIYARQSEKDGKFQLLSEHLTQTGVLSEAFGNNLDFKELSKLAGLLHDVGKATHAWQKYLLDKIHGLSGKKLDHATAGAKLIEGLSDGNQILAKTAIQASVMFHHGSGLPDMLGLDGSSEFEDRLNKVIPNEELGEIKERLSSETKDIIENCLKSDVWKNDGKKVLLDICKNGCCTKKKLLFNMGLHLRNFSSCLIDADRTDSAAFENMGNILDSEKNSDWNNLLLRLEAHLAKFQNDGKLGEIRESVSARCSELGRGKKGIYTCSAFTGAGKTLASLRFALEQAKKYEMEHVFIIAPYTSIIDQNADIIRSILEDKATKGRVVLECHSNLTSEKKNALYDSEQEYERYEETWDAPIIITTMVQFLETLYGSGTKAIRRMHRLSESVLVFDEVQTLPIKATYLFNWGIDYLVRCCGCSAMLCTATQPCLDKIGSEENSQYRLAFDGEIIQNVSEHFSSLERVHFLDMTAGGTVKSSVQDISSYIYNSMKGNRSFLAVVNTKSQAKELFNLVKESRCADFVYHLSTNMCPAHRRAKVADIRKHLSDGDYVVCISTRLIEAGVDLSFGGALRYLTGLDSIIQTAGRCNRNNELTDEDGKAVCGTLAIFDPENENIGSLEELKVGKECMGRVLREFQSEWNNRYCNLINPKVMEAFFKYYYASFANSLLKYSIKDKESSILDMLADNPVGVNQYERINQNQDWKRFPYRQAFKTAWDNFDVIADVTTGVVVPYKGNDIVGRLCALERCNEDFGNKLRSLLRESQQYTVNVYANQLRKLLEEKVIYEVLPDSGIYALAEEFYNDDFGLSSECFAGGEVGSLIF